MFVSLVEARRIFFINIINLNCMVDYEERVHIVFFNEQTDNGYGTLNNNLVC